MRYSSHQNVVVNIFNGHNAPFLSGIGADTNFTHLLRCGLSSLGRGPFVGITVNAIAEQVGPTVTGKKEQGEHDQKRKGKWCAGIAEMGSLRAVGGLAQMNKAVKTVSVGLLGILNSGLKAFVIDALAVIVNTSNLNNKRIGLIKAGGGSGEAESRGHGSDG
jgi:hypothetical protein